MMREQVIKGLECCMDPFNTCGILDNRKDCPYNEIGHECMHQMFRDAITLLKAQEAVEPTLDIRHGKSMWRCGSCSTALQPNQIHTKFCFNCGQAVKWE